MRNLTRIAAVATLALGTTVGAVTVAQAGDIECTTALGAATIDGNLIVPDDTVCDLTGTTVHGAIIVKSRAQLHADNIHATGGLQSQSPNTITLDDSTLDNGVSIQNAETTPGKPGGRISLTDNRISGDIQVSGNRVPVWLEDNPSITGSIQAQSNVAGIDISRNTIGNGLQCQDNLPAPTGGGNKAKQAQGQCATLATITP